MAGPEWEDLKKRLELSEHKRALLKNRLSKGSVEEDSTLWSFVDLMTLLLILFILFYSHALTRKDSSKNLSIEPSQIAVTQSFQIRETSATTELKTHDPDQATTQPSRPGRPPSPSRKSPMNPISPIWPTGCGCKGCTPFTSRWALTCMKQDAASAVEHVMAFLVKNWQRGKAMCAVCARPSHTIM